MTTVLRQKPKPHHLDPVFAEQFKDQGMVDAYPCRPPYPQEIFTLLSDLARGSARRVLDVGCGSGDIARRLVPLVGAVDAVDFSPAMIEAGKNLPGGDHPNLRWMVSRVEEFEPATSYGLVVAGESLHWMDWPTVMKNFSRWLMQDAFVAAVFRNTAASPWDADVNKLVTEYSTNRAFQPFDLLQELTARKLFAVAGRTSTKPEPFLQSVSAYVTSFHSRNGFSVDRMGRERAEEFDARLRDVLQRHEHAGTITLEISATLTWGLPT